MKRVSSILLVLILAISCLYINSVSVLGNPSDEKKEITLSLCSNMSSEQYISGIYYEDEFWVSCQSICLLSGGNIDSENEEELKFSLSNGQRIFSIDKKNYSIVEEFYSDSRELDVPITIIDDNIYMAVLPFLDYIGATVIISPDAPIQFWVLKHYDFFDALNDYVLTIKDSFFWWDEVDTEGDIGDRLVNNGVVALLNRDSNIFRMAIDAEGIEREAIEDALVTIVKNEGQSYADDDVTAEEIIDLENRVINRTGDADSVRCL